jgi:imidazolonepropionase-like amidohydrolase
VTYPLPVLQALVDETHRLGRKAACHAFGGIGLENSIAAGCDSVEHGYGLTQRQLDTMVQKGLAFDPTLVRYTEPYMDDNDAKNTGGKFRMIPIFDKAVAMAVATKGLKVMVGSGADGSTYPHGTQALDFEALVTRSKMTPARAIQAGTIVNAEVMGWQNEIGSITKGKFADVVAVQGHPLTDITELQRVKFVMKGGKVVRNELTAP